MEQPNTPFSAYKSINSYNITQYDSYASHYYIHVSGSTSNSGDVQILRGVQYTGSITNRTNPVTEYELFDSIVQTFYSSLPYAMYGIKSGSYYPTRSLFAISVTQDVFGTELVPSTVKLVIDNTSSFDDGKGNMYISQSGTGYQIGSVFYDQGIILLQATSSNSTIVKNDGISIVGGTQVDLSFSSSVYLVEHIVTTKLEQKDFTISPYNPDVFSIPFTGSTVPIIESMLSQSIKPYITSIGLYNDDNDLLAIAKLSIPIKRTFDTTQTFVIKFDT